MKKLIYLLAVLALMLCGCGGSKQEDAKGVASEQDVAQLDALYEGAQVYYGEFHDHADTGGNSDGHATLTQWKDEVMPQLDMDFATIVDHKQMTHMELPEWDETTFIGGSEAATWLTDHSNGFNQMHYNMIFATAQEFDQFLTENNERFNFEYSFGIGNEGQFFDNVGYRNYSREQLRELAAEVMESGGFFTHVHPKYDDYLLSDDPLDYWMGDGTGLEVLCGYHGDMTWKDNQEAYDTWVQLLNMGKRIYATAGSDSHKRSNPVSLSAVYLAGEKNATALLNQFRAGNFVAGPAGIKMCVGDAVMGGSTDFTGKRLVVAAGDVHSQEGSETDVYRLDIYNDKGLVFSQEFSRADGCYVALDAENCMYYRADVYNVTGDRIIAIGNPIWNDNAAQ